MSLLGIDLNSTIGNLPEIVDEINTKFAQLSAVAPNGLNATQLVINNKVAVRNDDTTPTAVINLITYAVASVDPSEISWVGDGKPLVMQTLDATDLQILDTTLELKQTTGTPQTTDITATDISIVGGNSATWANIINNVGGGIPSLSQVLTVGQSASNQNINGVNVIEMNDALTYLTSASLYFGANNGAITGLTTINGLPYPPTPLADNLTQVLTAGNNASGLNMGGIGDIALSTINGYPYPPSAPDLNSVLSSGNSAGSNSIDMNGQQILNCSNINTTQINGSSITTVGLNWSDFTGNNAFTNLPNQSYSVDNYSGLQTEQKCDYFRATNSSINAYGELNAYGIDIRDVASSTSTLYQSNNLTIQNGTAYTITQSSGQNVNVNCGQFVVNGVPFKVPIYYETHTNSNFGIGGGSFSAIGSAWTWGGLIPNQSYLASIQFSMSCDTYESSSSVYLDYSNSNGSWNSNTYSSSSYPCPQTGSNNTFSGASGYSCFTIIDSITFTADSFGQLNIQLNAGHYGGFWNTNYRWTFIGTILQP
jgi:hypothetical protein